MCLARNGATVLPANFEDDEIVILSLFPRAGSLHPPLAVDPHNCVSSVPLPDAGIPARMRDRRLFLAGLSIALFTDHQNGGGLRVYVAAQLCGILGGEFVKEGWKGSHIRHRWRDYALEGAVSFYTVAFES